MHKRHARTITAKAVRIDPRPAIAVTALAILATLLIAARAIF